MMLPITNTVFGGLMVGMTWFAARKRAPHPNRESADDAAMRDLYAHYLTGIDELTQTYLLQGPSDQEWLEGIRARASAPGRSRQAEPSRVHRLLSRRILGVLSTGLRLILRGWLPLLAAAVAGAIIAGGTMLPGSLILEYAAAAIALFLLGVVGGWIAIIRLAIHREKRDITIGSDERVMRGARVVNGLHVRRPAAFDEPIYRNDLPR